jgi:hypothetical protein
MKRYTKREGYLFRRQSERGAALLTVLLLSTLLLSAGLTLLMSTSLSATTAIDSTAEMQAYFGAEAGLEATLNVLRGNVAPDASLPAGTKINFRNAANPPTSDNTSDTYSSGNAAIARLSGWLNYTYQNPSSANDWRVPVTANYAPLTGIAYSIVISDPDDVGPIATRKIRINPAYRPSRLLIQSMGYGPKGARKRLEMIVKSSGFDYAAPATIMMIGANAGTPMTDFEPGSSGAKYYSGHDHDPSGTAVLPAFGATSPADELVETSAKKAADTVDAPIAATIPPSSLPTWIQSANQARTFLAEQKEKAKNIFPTAPGAVKGRYFTSFDGTSGSISAPAFTFVDGDASLDGGAGLLIVTGNLEMKGNPSFDGLILVLGGGTVNRDGGGKGNIYGAMLVARFDLIGPGGFLAPTFHTNGGGDSTMQYDSVKLGDALNTTGARVIGVREHN